MTIANPNIKALHRQIVMMHLAGMRHSAIARFIESTPEYISQVLKLPTVQRYLLQLQASYVDDLRPIAERVNKTIEEHSLRAAEVVHEIMEEMHQREEVRAKALALSSAQDILDRAGHKPTQRVESRNLHGHVVSSDTFERMTDVLREMNGEVCSPK